MIKCKITVIRTSFNKDLVEEYVEKERKKHLALVRFLKRGRNLS